jgi:hypothetical protein
VWGTSTQLQYGVVNSGLCACKADTLPLEPLLQHFWSLLWR